MENMRSPLLKRHGAVPAEGVDAKVAAHYGDPSGEWRMLESGHAFVDLSHMDIVEVSGPERLTWLHSLVSQNLEHLSADDSTEALILDPNGHIQSAFFVYDDGSSTYLIADPDCGDELADFLTSMIFMRKVKVQRRYDLCAIGTVLARKNLLEESEGASLRKDCGGTSEISNGLDTSGDDALSCVENNVAPCVVEIWDRMCLFVWRDPWPCVSEGGATYTWEGEEHPAVGWRRVIGVVENLEDAALTLEKAGYLPAGMLAWEASRIAAWRPRGIAEAATKVLPHELDWLRTAVHLRKGCYRGQETVAKLVNLGRPPRRFVELYLEGPVGELPVPGETVFYGEREAGLITSACQHPHDGPVALALVKRNLPSDAVLRVGVFTAGQRLITDPSGKSSATPERRPGEELRRKR